MVERWIGPIVAKQFDFLVSFGKFYASRSRELDLVRFSESFELCSRPRQTAVLIYKAGNNVFLDVEYR